MNYWKISTFVLAAALACVVGGGFIGEAAAEKEAQPHMRAALVNLKQARNQLEKATHDKGGHRVKALELTNSAITEVEKGIQADNNN
jgi:hypothetical protein